MKNGQHHNWYVLVGMAIFVAMPFAAFGLGVFSAQLMLIGEQPVTGPIAQDIRLSQDPHAGWLAYSDPRYGISVRYPREFELKLPQTPDEATVWSYSSNGTGTLLLDIVVPRIFEPKTNFGEGTVRVGVSRDPQAVEGCLLNPMTLTNCIGDSRTFANCILGPSESATTSVRIVNGTEFTTFHTSDAAAGNRYDITAYRTMRGGACFGIDLVSHWSELLNYPPEFGLREFDHARVDRALDAVMQTFSFVPAT